MMMRRVNNEVIPPQTVNACSLISVSVIAAITGASSEEEMVAAIKDIVPIAEYLFSHHHDPQGFSMEDAIKEHNKNHEAHVGFRVEKTQANIVYAERSAKKISKEELMETIRDEIASRNSLSIEQWTAFSGDESISDALKAAGYELSQGANLLESSADQIINALVETRALTPRPPIEEQIEKQINLLKEQNAQGCAMTFGGHTISAVRKGQLFYTYDSLTGELDSTDNIAVLAQHLKTKFAANRENEIQFHHIRLPDFRKIHIHTAAPTAPEPSTHQQRSFFNKQRIQNNEQTLVAPKPAAAPNEQPQPSSANRRERHRSGSVEYVEQQNIKPVETLEDAIASNNLSEAMKLLKSQIQSKQFAKNTILHNQLITFFIREGAMDQIAPIIPLLKKNSLQQLKEELVNNMNLLYVDYFNGNEGTDEQKKLFRLANNLINVLVNYWEDCNNPQRQASVCQLLITIADTCQLSLRAPTAGHDDALKAAAIKVVDQIEKEEKSGLIGFLREKSGASSSSRLVRSIQEVINSTPPTPSITNNKF
ncbi:MAG: hypothetical protein KIT56_07235 [Gammaproteobacteria bacterium]|nr:hypothetical protein [Gammaproteobacteria bacterium]MCW5583655.1 hypothetical protein [Gammaproteobacteria bacterium]